MNEADVSVYHLLLDIGALTKASEEHPEFSGRNNTVEILLLYL